MWKGCCIAWVNSVPFSETVLGHHGKLDEFQLDSVEHGTEYQGSCRISLQTCPVSSLILDLVVLFNYSINDKDPLLAGCCSPEEIPVAC